jgi:homoaconitase/3-isopropylmalate dehydratase large subunit
MTRTLYDKLWERHAVHVEEDGTTLLYIGRHLLNEVMSPQAFEGLRMAGPQMAAAAAIMGHFVDVGEWQKWKNSSPAKAWRRRWTGPMSTPTRSYPSSS